MTLDICYHDDMERLLAIDFAENQKLQWIEKQKEYYRATGDYTIYSLPPVILANDNIDFDSFFETEKEIIFSKPAFTEGIAYLRPEGTHENIKGLFISRSMKALDYQWDTIKANPTRLLLIEKKDLFFRIIASRCLSTYKEKR